MPIIKILPHPEYAPNGAQVEAPSGTSICEALLDNGIAIEHACDMSCACTTCHVVVREGFASLNGPKHYKLQPNEERITLEKVSWTAPEEIKVAGPEERALVYRGGETIEWRVVS